MSDDSRTWHYGIVARWWAEFTTVEPDELAYYVAAIRRYGEPALDFGCGTGRLLIPLLEAGFDVDGTDISIDMLTLAGAKARDRGLTPRLTAQATHQLDLDRTYRTIYMCGVLGIGGRRDRDREAIQRAFQHLEPGGVLLIDHELPYKGETERGWAIWLAGHRGELPGELPEPGDRRRAADGDELELRARLLAFDPLAQIGTMEMRPRLWRDGVIVAEEEYTLDENVYFAQEIKLLLDDAGFDPITIERAWSGEPASGDDGKVMFVARRR